MTPMRHARKALAASFVVTFAPGCDSRSAQPPASPTVDVGSPPPAVSGAAGATGGSGASTGDDAGAVAALPPAPSVGHVVRNADGTCTWFADRGPRNVNGRIIPMNPPAPHQVQCPPGDGGTSGTGGP